MAADANVVAWGYADGTVIAFDAAAGLTWEFHGHIGVANYIVIDAASSRIVSASRRDIRVWDIKAPPAKLMGAVPCSIFHVEPSPDGRQVALDCNDGIVRVWSRLTGAITHVHRQLGYAFGLQWVGGLICSGSIGDSRVLCSRPDGTATQVFDSHSKSIPTLTAGSNLDFVVFGSADGQIWRSDHGVEVLYAHHGAARRAAISKDDHWLSSCAEDGSLAMFDLTTSRLLSHLIAHVGAYCGVSWAGNELWSWSGEGTLKRWAIRDGELHLQHLMQARAAIRLLVQLGGGWTAVEGASTLLVSRDRASVALRIDAGKAVTALDVSPDQRYVAASTNGEIIVIDLANNAVATLATGTPIQQVRFLEPALLAFSEPAALKTLRVDQLTYVPFVPTPEAPNRASF